MTAALSEILFSSGALAILSTMAIALLEAFAWGVQKTTLYTITNKRIVMRIGVALSATFNLPFTRIVSADMREDKNGNGRYRADAQAPATSCHGWCSGRMCAASRKAR
jgi:hypothetical protein